MKLSIEEIDAIRISLRECAGEDGCKALGVGDAICSEAVRCKRVMNLIDTIEAQQQEIEQLNALAGKMNVCDLVQENLRLNNGLIHTKLEIKQLHAQAAAMREVIMELKPSCGLCNPENCSPDCGNIGMFEMIDAALSSDAGKDYHNPADAEAFEWVKEFIERVYNGLYESCPTGHCLSREQIKYIESVREWQSLLDAALKAIGKVLGGDAECQSK